MARAEISEIALRVPTVGGPLYPASGASVQVNVRGGGAATVYTAGTGPETRPNPLTADTGGRIEGWLEAGSYDLVVTDGGSSYAQPYEAASGAAAAPDASSTVKGITRLSVAPAVASAPIALGANDPALAAKANLSAGKVPTGELGGAAADATKYLRGDQTWAVPSGGGGAAESGDGLQAGVVRADHCALTVNSTSQVTIAAGVVWIKNAPGVLVRAVPVSTVLGTIPAAVNNRIDQVVVDSAGAVSRLQGTTDVAGNTLAANPQTGGGRAAVPAGSQLLHDIQVTSAGVLAANVRDRRSWATGRFAASVAGVSTLLIPGLSGNLDFGYYFAIHGTTAGAIHLRPNEIPAGTVGRSRIWYEGEGFATGVATYATGFVLDQPSAGDVVSLSGFMSARANRVRHSRTSGIRTIGANMIQTTGYAIWTDTTTVVDRLLIDFGGAFTGEVAIQQAAFPRG